MKFTEGQKDFQLHSYEWKTGHLTIEQILVIFSIHEYFEQNYHCKIRRIMHLVITLSLLPPSIRALVKHNLLYHLFEDLDFPWSSPAGGGVPPLAGYKQ